MKRLRQFLCSLRGHEWRTRGINDRIVQVCDFCERESNGVPLGNGPRKRFDGDPKRHQLNRPRIVRRSA